jgi:hypothetical protein
MTKYQVRYTDFFFDTKGLKNSSGVIYDTQEEGLVECRKLNDWEFKNNKMYLMGKYQVYPIEE